MTSPPPSKERKAYVASHVGFLRKHNEDACAISSATERLTNWVGSISSQDGWALVADGIGGHVAGEIASAMAIELLRPKMAALKTGKDIEAAINMADQGLFMAMEMRPELHGLGTTIAGVILRPSKAITFNAGDSRCYVMERGALIQVSVDDRTKRGRLLQCLGGFQEPGAMHVHTCPVEGDATILLCSDGLSDLVTDNEICSILSSRAANPAEALVDAALKAGGSDNVTVVVIESPP